CGPCRQLGPVLERLVSEADGAWELVKVNVDDNPRTAAQYRVQGIPAVKGFRGGQMVAEFTGAVPEPQVRAFLTRLQPSEADVLARQGAEMEQAGYLATAEDRYRDALTKDANHARAVVGLARVLAAREATDEALTLLDRLPGDPEVKKLRAELGLKQSAGDTDLAALEARLSTDPKDAAAHSELGRTLAARGDYEPALEHLLETVRLDRSIDNDSARKAMLDIFALLGDADERTQRYRRLLGSVLF
ncbi:MAG: tetratricopeptide repeat protein, partial [Dehalococcoidia bacterium]